MCTLGCSLKMKLEFLSQKQLTTILMTIGWCLVITLWGLPSRNIVCVKWGSSEIARNPSEMGISFQSRRDS